MKFITYLKTELKNTANTVNTLMNAAGSHVPDLKRSILFGFLESLCFGLALLCFYPMSKSWVLQNHQIIFNEKTFIFWAFVFVLIVLVAFVMNWKAQNYQVSGKAIQAAYEARLKLGERLREIPQEILSSEESGELNSILLANVEEAVLFTSFLFRLVISAFVIPVVVMFGTLFFDWRVALILLLILPVNYGLYLWRRPAFQRGFTYLSSQTNKMKGELIQFVQGITVIKSCNVTESQLSEYEKMCSKVKEIQYIGQKKGGKPNLIITSSVFLGLIISVSCGTYWVTNGSLALGALAAIAVAITHLSSSFSLLVLYAAALEIFSIGKKNIDRVMNMPLLPVKNQLEQRPKDYSVSYHDVTYNYQNTEDSAVQHINITLPEKSMTAIIGGSGSGKTTLVKLLCRSMDVTAGRIEIGGVDVRDLPMDYLMSLISVVFQDVYLFNDTIYNNIKMGREDAAENDIYEAAKLAQCHDFIVKLPDGYETLVGDVGGRLSGGEKQRISIARALLKNAPIIILDEPTAALDTENEVKVQKAIDSLIKDKTVIVISHRLSTITGANKIIVLDEGKIIESGLHEHLLQEQGKYQYYWNLQQSII